MTMKASADRRRARHLGNEDGLALIMAIMGLSLMIILGLGLSGFAILESQIARSYIERTHMGLIADAGAKHGVAALGRISDLNRALLGPDSLPSTADDGVLDGYAALGPGEAIPAAGVSFAGGSYTVTVVDDAEPGDTSGFPNATDTNGIVLLEVEATGYGSAKSSVTVTFRATPGGWDLGTLSAALTAGNGLRKNSMKGGIDGNDGATSSDCPVGGQDPLAGLVVPEDGLQFSGDPDDEVFDGDPHVLEVDDPLTYLRDMDIDWEGILNASFDYVIDQNPPLGQWPDFASLPADEFPSIIVTSDRVDLRSLYNGRGLLVVSEELRINNDFEWDGVILVGDFMQSNGKMAIRGGIVTGLNLLLGRDPDDMNISAVGPGEAQITYNSCMVAEAQNAGGGNSWGSPQPVAWVSSW